MKISLNQTANNAVRASNLQGSKNITSNLDLLFSASSFYPKDNSLLPVLIGKEKFQIIQPKLAERKIKYSIPSIKVVAFNIYKFILHLFKKNILVVKSYNKNNTRLTSRRPYKNNPISNTELRVSARRVIH